MGLGYPHLRVEGPRHHRHGGGQMSRDYLNLCQTFYRRRNIYMSNDALVVGGTSPGTTPPAWWLNLDWKLSSRGTTQKQRSCHAFIWAPFRVFRVKFLTAMCKIQELPELSNNAQYYEGPRAWIWGLCLFCSNCQVFRHWQIHLEHGTTITHKTRINSSSSSPLVIQGKKWRKRF